MKRRHFLLCASASALALALPLPALAAPPVTAYPTVLIHKLEVIEGVLDTLEQYRFGQYAKANVFGIPPKHAPTLYGLRDLVQRVVIDHDEPNTKETLEHFTVIRELLDRRYGRNNVSDHLWWLAAKQPVPGRTCRDLLETGDMADLRRVSEFAVAQILHGEIA